MRTDWLTDIAIVLALNAVALVSLILLWWRARHSSPHQ